MEKSTKQTEKSEIEKLEQKKKNRVQTDNV